VLFGFSTRDSHAQCIYWRTFSADENTCKPSDAAENLQLYLVVQFFHPRSSCMTTYISVDIQRITLNASCMTISGERTKQLDIFCCVIGFTSDFLSFTVVELIRFFHGALRFAKFKGDLWVAVASVPVGFMSGVDMLMMVVGLCCHICWRDHAWLVMLRLYLLSSTAGAQLGRARIIYNAAQSPSVHSTFPHTTLH